MRFTNPKRRQAPAVIIISLIDVMIVMLIFLMVTTAFKEHPAIKLKLPDSQDAQEGVTENHIVVTIAKDPLFVYIGKEPIKTADLKPRFMQEVKKNPQIALSVRADKEAAVQQLYDVLGAANAAGIHPALSLLTEPKK